MAVISKSVKIEVGTKLVRKNFSEPINRLKSELANEIEKFLPTIVPSQILTDFSLYPEFFKSCKEISLNKYNVDKRRIPKDFNSSFYISVPLNSEAPFDSEELTKVICSQPDDSAITQIIIKLIVCEKERCFTQNQITCIMENTVFTEKKLKSEFPEAYEVYLEIKKKQAGEKPALCDSIENIRAFIKKNKE